MSASHRLRRGSSYLEVQVAMILLAIGMSGLYSISVIQTRQTARLTSMLHPDDVLAINQNSNRWARKLGVYADIENSVTPVYMPYPQVSYVDVIDDADGGGAVVTYRHPSDPHSWVEEHDNKYYKDDGTYKMSDGQVGSWFEFVFTGVPPGEYEVLTTYAVWTDNADKVEHRIYDGNTFRGKTMVDQRVVPTDERHDHADWKRIAVTEFLSGTARIRLVDSANAVPWIIADGMMIRTTRSLDLKMFAPTVEGGYTAELKD